MNKLDIKTRVTILNMLVEGSSMRSISRITGVSINTVTKLLEDAGVTDTLRDMAWLVGIIDAAAPAPKPRGPYKKRVVRY